VTKWRLRVLAVTGLVLAVLYLLGVQERSPDFSNIAQLVAGCTAAAMCHWVGWRCRGPERAWRVLTGIGMTGWSAGQLIYSWYRFIAGRQLGSPSWADAGYLSLPVFTLVALVLLVSDRVGLGASDPETNWRRTRAALTVCAVVISGAMFVVTWSTRGSGRSGPDPSVVVGIIYLISDIITVVMAGLLITVWRVGPAYRTQLRLLALALASIALSDGLYAYLVNQGLEQFPPTDAGFVVGPYLVAVAAAVMPGRRRRLTGEHFAPPPRARSPGREEPWNRLPRHRSAPRS
jgi:hypothetical protein